LLSGRLPFQAESSQDWEAVISSNMAEKAPSVLDWIDEDRRSDFDCSLAFVIAKALEKRAVNRYLSASEMHGAVFQCLVVYDKAAYSIYLSYRAESDGPLVKLLFDELNHSRTPGGHRVTVYLDTCSGHVQGADWDEDIAKGLLHTTLYCPILSKGATAHMAQFACLAQLGGADLEQDQEDSLLKEMLIADALLDRSSHSDDLLGGKRGKLCAAFPVFAGRQQQPGHSEYSLVDNYFNADSDGDILFMLHSPSNGQAAQAAARFLQDRAGLTVEVVKQIEDSERSVASLVAGLSPLPVQVCCLWNHAGVLAEAALTREQSSFVEKGCATVDDNLLSTEQVVPLSLVPACPPTQCFAAMLSTYCDTGPTWPPTFT
jgi:hypothetical protein